jgi:hypothetical protein
MGRAHGDAEAAPERLGELRRPAADQRATSRTVREHADQHAA